MDATLSERELEVIELAASGLGNIEIAARLQISDRTVQAHLANAMRKSGTRSRTALAVGAVMLGLVSPTVGFVPEAVVGDDVASIGDRGRPL